MPSSSLAAPPAHPVLGHYPEYAGDPLGFLTHCARAYGDVVPLRMPGLRLFLLNHPRDVAQVLADTHRSFINHRGVRIRPARRVFGRSLLTVEGSVWRSQRRLAYPAFRHERLDGYSATMAEAVASTIASWTDGVRDVHADLSRLSLTMVGRTLFDHAMDPYIGEIEEAFRHVHDAFVARSWVRSALTLLSLPVSTAFDRAASRLEAIVEAIIEERRHRDDGGDSLLSMLMAAVDESGRPVTPRQLRDEVLGFLVTGYTTTSLAMTWSCYLLAAHPSVQRCVADEAIARLGARRPRASDLPSLPIATSVSHESLRLYPPGWIIGREATRDCLIGDVPIPRGAQLIMCQWASHRDPRYFDAPEEFRPDRWSGAGRSTIPRGAYYPFGGGARLCIGHALGELATVLMLSMTTREVEMTTVSDARPEPIPSLALVPKGGMTLRIARRLRRVNAGERGD